MEKIKKSILDSLQNGNIKNFHKHIDSLQKRYLEADDIFSAVRVHNAILSLAKSTARMAGSEEIAYFIDRLVPHKRNKSLENVKYKGEKGHEIITVFFRDTLKENYKAFRPLVENKNIRHLFLDCENDEDIKSSPYQPSSFLYSLVYNHSVYDSEQLDGIKYLLGEQKLFEIDLMNDDGKFLCRVLARNEQALRWLIEEKEILTLDTISKIKPDHQSHWMAEIKKEMLQKVNDHINRKTLKELIPDGAMNRARKKENGLV